MVAPPPRFHRCCHRFPPANPFFDLSFDSFHFYHNSFVVVIDLFTVQSNSIQNIFFLLHNWFGCCCCRFWYPQSFQLCLCLLYSQKMRCWNSSIICRQFLFEFAILEHCYISLLLASSHIYLTIYWKGLPSFIIFRQQESKPIVLCLFAAVPRTIMI